jgi:CBS domain-containing protein
VSARVFLAQLAGTGVFDPYGDVVGRVRDAVATLGSDLAPPRILGLIIDIQHRQRHRIFVPMGRVSRIEADAVVLTSGSVNIKRFEPRSSELLVLSELLDRTVTARASSGLTEGTALKIVDVAMEPNRTKDWVIVRLAVRAGASGRLTRRRGQVWQVEWSEVDGLALSLPESEQSAHALVSLLSDLRPTDLASAIRDMPPKRRREVAVALDDERLADVLEELSEDDQVAIMRELADERAADVLEAMNDDDAADLLGELPAADQERLLTLMEPDEAAPVRRLLRYADYTAGGMMTSEPVVLLPDATVAEALARVRNPDLAPALASQVFVVRPPQATPTGKFLGTAHLQRLLREPPSALVSGLLDSNIDPLTPETPLADITRHFAAYNLLAAPVVDDSHRLIGAVSVDDVLDHLLPEDWRNG